MTTMTSYASTDENIIEPTLPIIDAHHHLWFLPEPSLHAMEASPTLAVRMMAPTFRKHARYLFDEFLSDIGSGHNIRASVYVDAHAMYRADGPDALRSVGEVEFVNGIAAMSASGLFGDARLCAGIVGGVDLTLPRQELEILLDAHQQAGGRRYRGVRFGVAYDPRHEIMRPEAGRPHLLADQAFRDGFALLAPRRLSFDAWLFAPQIPELVELARDFPETQIVLNHCGAPVGLALTSEKRADAFSQWRADIAALSGCPNVAIKLGGLGIPFAGFASYAAVPPASSSVVAAEWRPHIETCIEAFGVKRCMFASNFPVDSAAADYRTLWNAFKRICRDASDDEKADLFAETARRTYAIDITL